MTLVPDRPPVLLSVFAHPDDETFRCGGFFALLAGRGVQVYVLTATRGEAGSCGEPQICTTAELAEVRECELQCACNVLGIRPPIFLDYSDGKLDGVDEEEAVARIEKVIRDLRPQILLTWPADGLSDHPDHKAVSRWVTKAFIKSEKLDPNAPKSLYYIAIPVSLTVKFNNIKLHSVPDNEINLEIDVNPVWEKKMKAIRCHQTQIGESPILNESDKYIKQFFGKEFFILASKPKGKDFISEILNHKINSKFLS